MQWREGRPAHAAGRVAAAAATSPVWGHVLRWRARVLGRCGTAGRWARARWPYAACVARACMAPAPTYVPRYQRSFPPSVFASMGALSEAERDICRGQPYLRVATTMARSLHCFPALPLSLSCFCNTKTCSYLASESSRLRVAFEEETSPSRVSTKQCTTAFINGQKGR
jgi:hypothetical protein